MCVIVTVIAGVSYYSNEEMNKNCHSQLCLYCFICYMFQHLWKATIRHEKINKEILFVHNP